MSIARKPSTRSGDRVFVADPGFAQPRSGARLKKTTRAPVACNSERRLISLSTTRPPSDAGSALDRAHDPEMGSAETEIVRKFRFYLLLRRLWIVCQQGCRLHDHPVDAVAALHG